MWLIDRTQTQAHVTNVAIATNALAQLDRPSLEAIAEAAIGLLDELSDPDEDRCLACDDLGTGPAAGMGGPYDWR